MNLAERNAVAEVSRVVENYNDILATAANYDGRGQIALVNLPDDSEALIDGVLMSMQKTKLELEKTGKKGIAREVNACVNQVHDAKQLLA